MLAPIDAPLCEREERYRVTLRSEHGSLEIECGGPSIGISAADLAPLGAGTAHLQVRQVGDCAVSHPAEQQLTLS